MPKVVGVLFPDREQLNYLLCDDLELRPGTEIIGESRRGIEVGKVMTEPLEMPEQDLEQPPRAVIRIMTEEDRAQHRRNQERNREAFLLCERLIIEHNLDMKLIGAEQTFDGSRIFFYFVAEERVDFRALVRDLAAKLKTRIQMQQIGVRDAAKKLGGCGCCGRDLCCATWLTEFAPVSIRMAKDQGLPLNPNKLSGVCGRLKCCLRYENKFYCEVGRLYPRIGSEYVTPKGKGKVIERNLLSGMVTVEIPEQGRYTFFCNVEEPHENPSPVQDPGAQR